MSPSRSDHIFTTLGAWVRRVVSEDSFNNFSHWSLPLLAFHVHLVGLLNDFDQPMGVEMTFNFHRHHDFTKKLVITLLAGERHVAFIKRKHSVNKQATTDNAEDQHVLVARFWSDPPCTEYVPGQLEQSASHFVLVDEEFRIYQVPKIATACAP